jgi:hypothetical protein
MRALGNQERIANNFPITAADNLAIGPSRGAPLAVRGEEVLSVEVEEEIFAASDHAASNASQETPCNFEGFVRR